MTWDVLFATSCARLDANRRAIRKVVHVTSALPARPDLEHLRREAKQLLRQLRAAEPAAVARLAAYAPGLEPALSTAQLIVAREYGFSSWTQLKNLVSRMSAGGVRYDTIGRGYSAYRQADPRIVAAVHTALGDARTVVNVGAGAGSYEPTDRPVIPIEPSTAMAMQRDVALPPAVLGVAESLPLADDSVDAAMGVLTMHHWADLSRGLAELVRVARKRIVLLTIDVEVEAKMWLFSEYAPEIVDRDRREFPEISRLAAAFNVPTRVVNVPVPADCTDGFCLAFWSRPEAVLDPGARAATSGFARMDVVRQAAAVARLERDLDSGRWERRHGHLRSLPALDVGLRLVIAEVS
jgi:SAM-dependent methyltransferase